MKNKDKKAIILLSGGIDSTVTLAIAKSENYDITAITFRYGQRHKAEIISAKKIVSFFKVKRHIVVDIDLKSVGASALTDPKISVPVRRTLNEIASDGIPVTYVPARNTIFLSYALAWCESLKIENIFIGVNAVDYSGYPDCRSEYISAFERMANLALKATVEKTMKIKIQTPLINLSKGEIIKKGVELAVDFNLTHSCYNSQIYGVSCGECDSCLLRKKGFDEAGIKDSPIII